jgi:hypothetical protein
MEEIMLKNKFRFLVFVLVICMSAISIFAQTQEDFQKQLEKTIDLASKTATFENGKIKSVKIFVNGEGEKLLNFEHAADGKSFTIIDDQNKRIQVFLDKNQISSVKMPDGGEATYKYTENSDGSRNFSDVDFTYINRFGPNHIPRQTNPCRDAIVASSIALAVCAASGPLSAGCWAATANAAYHTYRCYESTH